MIDLNDPAILGRLRRMERGGRWLVVALNVEVPGPPVLYRCSTRLHATRLAAWVVRRAPRASLACHSIVDLVELASGYAGTQWESD